MGRCHRSSESEGALEISYEGGKVLLKIAKNQLNKIKIKPTRQTQIINNFYEIISIIKEQSH